VATAHADAHHHQHCQHPTEADGDTTDEIAARLLD